MDPKYHGKGSARFHAQDISLLQVHAICIQARTLDFCQPQVYATSIHVRVSLDFCPPRVYATSIQEYALDFCPPQVCVCNQANSLGFCLLLVYVIGVKVYS